MLEVRVRHEGDTAVVAPVGAICLVTSPVLERCLASTDLDGRRVVVDLADVTILSAQGIAVLVDASRVRRDNGGDLIVQGATGLVARVLEITGVHGHLCQVAGDDTSATR
jgi:anti-sigma B factor antagonist